MAGRGPAPNENARRRNGRVEVVASGLDAPDLPGAGRMLRETRDWYEAVCASPAAAAFESTDWHRVFQIARLRDLEARAYHDGDHKTVTALSAEVRQLEAPLALYLRDRLAARVKSEPKTPDVVVEDDLI